MIYKIPASQPGLVCIVFELPSSIWADRIVVSGTFNNWNEQEVPMHQDRSGVWRARIELPIGQRYEYRYLVDGRWQTDCHSASHAETNFGSCISWVLGVRLAVSPAEMSRLPHSRIGRSAYSE
jgi:hypothetical protein